MNTYPNTDPRELQRVTGLIVHEIYRTYFAYGPGIFEKVYEASLAGRLQERGLKVERQKQILISDDYVNTMPAFYADLVVEDMVIVELKSVSALPPVAWTQLRSYLRLSGLSTGILVNFNTDYIKKSIYRVTDEFHGRAA